MKLITKTTALLLMLVTSAAFASGTIKGKILYKKKRWVRNTAVYLDSIKGDWKPKDAAIDQKGSTFIPKFTHIIVGSTVTFQNSDPTDHNVYSPDNEKYNLGTKPQGGKLSHTFKSAGVYTQLCKLHPTMLAYIVVTQNPFYGLSDKKGDFIIENVPAGKHKLLIWNERYKADEVEVVVEDDKVAEVAIKLHR